MKTLLNQNTQMKEYFLLLLSFCLLICGFSAIKWLNLSIFIAYVPILIYLRTTSSRYQLHLIYLILFLSNIISLFWLKNTLSNIHYIILCLLFTVFSMLPFYVYKKKLNTILFLTLFLFLEFVLVNSKFTYPMSLLGLSLTSYPNIIQWWEYTGLIGGSLWILVVNLTLFNLFFKVNIKNIITALVIISFPLIISFYISKQEIATKKSNIGFYAIRTDLPAEQVKYQMSSSQLTKHLVQITKEGIEKEKSNDNTVILFPETALIHPKSIKKIKDKDFDYLFDQGLINDKYAILTGGLLKEYDTIDQKLEHTFKHKGDFMGEEYLLFNSVFFLSKEKTDYRVKEKLVPFNEYLPYYQFMGKHLTKFLYNGVFHFSTYDNRKNFEFKEINITPLICYESFVGNFVRKFINTDVIVVGLNEGWYNSKKGFRLAEGHALARAIENRRDIIKSSNCGVTSYINYKGQVIKNNYNKESAFLVHPNICRKKTIYSKYGDYIGLIALVIFCLQMILIKIK